MSLLDITRHIHQPDKGYTGVVRLQGSIVTDSDENDAEHILRDNRLATFGDVVGAYGSSNDGFKVIGLEIPFDAPDRFDIRLAAGSFFIGGHRFALSESISLREQADALGFDPQTDLFTYPQDLPTADRYLVVMEGWEQDVSPTEDRELLEAGLDFVPTSGRRKPLARIRILPAGGEDCHSAFAAHIQTLESDGSQYDPDTGALRGTTRLRIDFQPGGGSEDLCSPRNASGYLGADNETIQVKITRPGHFIWSVQNAAPLYRIRLNADPTAPNPTALTSVEMLTPPRDQITQPRAGDVVEILGWQAILPNGEKLATRTGVLARVSSGYDAQSRSFDIENADSALMPLQDWVTTGKGMAYHGMDGAYLYMRVWRGDVMPSGRTDLAMDAVNGTPLGTTGVIAHFTGDGRPGDAYVFSVRPGTADVVTPWAFGTPQGAPPTTLTSYVAPLGFIDFSRADRTGNYPLIDDCRRKFRKVSAAGSCCEVTVGDGVHSHGDYRNIQAAIDALPVEGGKVCILKGVFRQTVDIVNRRNITVEGCGALTRMELPANAKRSLVAIEGCQAITLTGLNLIALEDVAVTVSEDTETAQPYSPISQNIRLRNLRIEARDAAAVLASPVDTLSITDCQVWLAPLDRPLTAPAQTPGVRPGHMPGFVLKGTNIDVVRTHMSSTADVLLHCPTGGIHLLEGSRDVRIQDNRIQNIAGQGLMLGSWAVEEIDVTIENDPVRDAVISDAASDFAMEMERRAALRTPETEVQVESRPSGASRKKDKMGGTSTDKKDKMYGTSRDKRIKMYGPAKAQYGGGRVSYATAYDSATEHTYTVEPAVVATANGCGQIHTGPAEPQQPGDTPVKTRFVVGDPIENLVVKDNVISDTGRSGIGVQRFFDIEAGGPMISVIGLDVSGNRIHDCMRFELGRLSDGLIRYAGFGGIALAAVTQAVFRDNYVSQCGKHVSDPVCGIFLLSATGALFEGNTIVENGGQPDETASVGFGPRAGLYVKLASAPRLDRPTLQPELDKVLHHHAFDPVRGLPALTIRGNRIVQPDGQALVAKLDGHASVTNNQLVSRAATQLRRILKAFVQAETEAEKAYIKDMTTAHYGLDPETDSDTDAVFKLIGGAVMSLDALPSDLDDGDLLTGGDRRDEWLLHRGEILVDGNQFFFLGINEVSDILITGVSIVATDDVGFHNNQYQANLLEPGASNQGGSGVTPIGSMHVFVLSLDSVRLQNNYVRHPVTQEKSANSDPRYAGRYDKSREGSLIAISGVVSATHNHVSGEITCFGTRGHRIVDNLQLLPGANI